MEEIFSVGNEKWLSKERNGKKGEINVLFSLLYRQIVRQAGWPEIALQIETQLGQRIYHLSQYHVLPTAHKCVLPILLSCGFVTAIVVNAPL